MSQSNAAAIRRRTNIQQTLPPTQNISKPGQQQQQQQASAATPATGLTLPQVIAVVDKRLMVLENFMKETKSAPVPANNNSAFDPRGGLEVPYATEVELNTVIDEFNSRFEMLATEINELKDLLMKLQSYTMDVNKMLLNERIQIFSEIDADKNSISMLDNYNQTNSTSVDVRDLAIQELSDQYDVADTTSA